MNAISRKKGEAPVLSSEAIEVHLQYLRSCLDRLEKRFERIDERFERIDVRFEKIDARFEKTDARLDKLSDGVAEVRGYQKALFWVLSLAGTGAAALPIARTFGWM
jgi:chromosome segregation ATPase